MSDTQTNYLTIGPHDELPLPNLGGLTGAEAPAGMPVDQSSPANQVLRRVPTPACQVAPSVARQTAHQPSFSVGDLDSVKSEVDNSSEHKKLSLQDPGSISNAAARREFEALRWPNGPVCPRCHGRNVIRLNGAASLLGQLNCRDCRRKFTVTTGTPLHRSNLPMSTWVKAIDLVGQAPRRYSSGRLRRDLEDAVSYKTAKRMRRRIPRRTANRSAPRNFNTPRSNL